MIYLDHASTTPMMPEAREAFLWALEGCAGNPSSRHAAGEQARKILEAARGRVAMALGCGRKDVVFTSTATEALNLAIRGVVDGSDHMAPHLVVSATEHKAVRETVSALTRQNRAGCTVVPPMFTGETDAARIAAAIRPETVLTMVMAVNNETGVIGDLQRVRASVGEEALILCDASQALGRVPIDVFMPWVDACVFSSHKMGGPLGAAALVSSKRFRDRLVPTSTGGSHEFGLRAGTENTPAIHAFSIAIARNAEIQESNHSSLLACRSLFESTITAALPDSIIVGTQTNRSPHISNVVFPGVESEILVSRLRGEIGISSASACNSFLTQPSHVLLAMGFPEAAALSSIRASFAPTTSLDAVRTAAARLCAVVTCIRSATESVN